MATLLLLLAGPVEDLADVLRRHEKQPYEQYRREQAIDDLGRIGTPQSTRLLEALLEDPWPHLRDAAVSALIALKRRSAEERAPSLDMLGDFLRRRSKPETRRHLATALGLIGDPRAVPPLEAALRREKDPHTAAAVAEALGRLGAGREALREKAARDPDARAACLRALGDPDLAQAHATDRDDDVRAAVVEVLARRHRPVLPDLEVDGRVGEHCGIALAEALQAARDPALARRRAEVLLAHPSWRVRAAAMEAVVHMRDATLVADLVDRLETEEGRLRHDAWRALRRLTGKDLPPDPAQWRALLPLATLPDEEGREDGLAGSAGTAAYYGLPVVSKRIAFLFDVSGSMRDDGKIEGAREHFHRTAEALADDQRFDLFVYRYLYEYPPRPRLERAFGELVGGNARGATSWLARQEARGAGALYDLLAAALGDDEVDTVYLLSDGVPSFGTVRRDYRILQEIRRLNRWRRVAIHTILLGTRGTDRAFMQRLAEENGGIAVDAEGRRLG